MRQILQFFTLTVLCLLNLWCTSFAQSNQGKSDTSWQKPYPAIWWQAVPRENAASWEILPQDAGFMEVILSKRNELGILSNFSEAPFVFHGVCYPTIEAFWQMMKYPEDSDDPRWSWASPWQYTRTQVSQMEGFSAKHAGNYANDLMDKFNADWVTFEGKKIPFGYKEPSEHFDLINAALIEKLRQNPEVQRVLLATGNLTLRPDHNEDASSPREFLYYLLWMDLRKLLQDKKLSLQTNENLALNTCKAIGY